MDENELVVTAALTDHQKEDLILQHFKDNFTTNPKKLCKMARRMWNDQPEWIRKGLLQQIMEARDPAALLQRFFIMMDEWKIIIPELIKEGNHGMIVDKHNNIFGFEIKTQGNWLRENDKWSPDQEYEIGESMLDAWMEQQGYNHFMGKIVLFDKFGFSGIARGVYRNVGAMPLRKGHGDTVHAKAH